MSAPDAPTRPARPAYIKFGALAPKLHVQLSLHRPRLRYLQTCADSIVTLAVGGFLTGLDVHRARKRLMKRIKGTI